MSVLSSRPIFSPRTSTPSTRGNPGPILSNTTRLLLPRSPHSFPLCLGPSPSMPISCNSSEKPQAAAWEQPKYVYPDPIPEFAIAETQKFRDELWKKLSKNKDTFGADIDVVVKVCAEKVRPVAAIIYRTLLLVEANDGLSLWVWDYKTSTSLLEIFSNFLHKEYGGPGTLLVEPFTDMLLALKEKKLPGAPVAARAALLWAQNYVDRDWERWTSQQSNRGSEVHS